MKISTLKKTVVVTLHVLWLASVVPVNATELNVRQSVGNGSLNKITSARLSGMFAQAPEESVESDKQFGRRGCVTSIGNQTSGTSLMGKPQDVNILGDVTNVCF